MVKIRIKGFLVVVRQFYCYEIFSSRFSGIFAVANVDTLFWRLSECASRGLILHEYKKVVKRSIEAAKGQIRREGYRNHV